MKWNEMEYNGSNSRDQTDIAEMLIFHRTPFSQILDQTLVEAWQELINPSYNFLRKLIKILFSKKPHQHKFLHYYQRFVSHRQLQIRS